MGQHSSKGALGSIQDLPHSKWCSGAVILPSAHIWMLGLLSGSGQYCSSQSRLSSASGPAALACVFSVMSIWGSEAGVAILFQHTGMGLNRVSGFWKLKKDLNEVFARGVSH